MQQLRYLSCSPLPCEKLLHIIQIIMKNMTEFKGNWNETKGKLKQNKKFTS
jgi:hypothetical protein